MLKIPTLIVGLSMLTVCAAFAQEPAHQPIQVMVLGMYHMDNPGLDEVNMVADDPLTPTRQAELVHTAERLAQFRPTKIAIEQRPTTDNFVWARPMNTEYIETRRNEIFQVAMRTGLLLGHQHLYAVDAPGQWLYDTVEALDARLTGGARIRADREALNRYVAIDNARLLVTPINEYLAWLNQPDQLLQNHQFMTRALRIANGQEQPAASFGAAWYERNLRICGNVQQIALPGDRIIVMFGQGHAWHLRNCFAETPGFVLVEPGPYLLGQVVN